MGDPHGATKRPPCRTPPRLPNVLLGEGIPVIGVPGFRHGERDWRTGVQCTAEQAKYATRRPLADAPPERFRELYEAVK